MRALTRRIYGGFSVIGFFLLILSGCGSGETVQGQAILLDESGGEFPAEGISIKIFDQDEMAALRRQSRAKLSESFLKLKGGESLSDFMKSYFSDLFTIVHSESVSAIEEGKKTDAEGLFDFSFPDNQCLLVAELTFGGEKLRWLRLLRRNAIGPEGVELRTENQLKFGGGEEFLSVLDIGNQFNDRLAELAMVAAWKPKLQQENESVTRKLWQPFLSYISPGTFLMGSPKQEPSRGEDETLHEVTISHGFWMGRYEVTNREWNAVWGLGDLNASIEESKEVREDHPVTQVSYGRAQAFCWKLTEMGQKTRSLPPGLIYRLPTEAEWEYACRAGEELQATIFGTELSTIKANYGGTQGKTTKVGKFKKEHESLKDLAKWDLYDMHGNVQEWCYDWYGDYPSTAAVDPLGVLRGKSRVLRGGSFYDAESRCRSACRDKLEPIYHSNRVGFRVVLGYPL